jgi:hydroxymethylpyrimidine/phosphomethylpyrimidine kinase
MKGRVLVVAGSDSGGGAGIQADIKTITALNAYAATAITAITVQNTLGVLEVHELSADLILAQMRAVLDDIGADAIKTGMLPNAAIIAAVAAEHAARAPIPLVVDPVMVAKGGAALMAPDALDALKTALVPRAAVLTPNVPEAETLTDDVIRTVDDMRRAAAALLAMGAGAVLLKGGHLDGPEVVDLLADAHGITTFTAPRIETRHTHGTGCTLASAIAAGLAQGMSLADAVARAHAYVQAAIRTAPGFGAGHGPLNHAHTLVSGFNGCSPAGGAVGAAD